MKVALDVTPLEQTRAGTARYLKALLPRLDREVSIERVRGYSRGRPGTLWLDLAWYPHVLPHRAHDADVLHCTTYRGPVKTKTPLVVTVHDVAVFRHPEVFPRWTRTYSRIVVPRVLRAATLVLAVSEFTASELETVLRIPREAIRVTPNAVDATFSPAGDRASGDYALAVGTLEPRKNLARTIEATARLGIELHVVGARGWGRVEANAGHVRWLGEISDEKLAREYRGALCVAYPSLYEGFGIPVLEAMACGTPVVTSRGGATEEVAGGAGILVDPLDVASIADGIADA
ncbi:MAG TPA: glycosyltransferase family 1 protein, partial [Gaiellaceae bacterium]|nr:glycosyltransferase family 1 protein [Gaiellaceae bacterium]